MSGIESLPADPISPARSGLERFAREDADALYTVFRRCLGDAELARDALQDTLLDAWKHRARYDPARPFRAWLFCIGRNRLRNLLRRRRLERRRMRLLSEEIESSGPRPGSRLLELERRQSIERAILGLSPEQRVAVILRYQEGFSCGEIGAVLGATANAVSIQLHRARRELKRALGSTLSGGEG
jgi:RNA polymerase sigma-70 factor (ECF subfamily)